MLASLLKNRFHYVFMAMYCGVLWSISFSAKAQYNAPFLNDSLAFQENDSNTFGAGIGVLQYMRNTEYFNPVELGRTLFGYQLTPELYYRASPHLMFRAGLFLRNDFGGENPYTSVMPQFSLKISQKQHTIIFGTLNSAYSHRLIEPMYDVARLIEHHPENGFQYTYQSDKVFWDTWIDWQRFIERGSPYKEKLVAGSSLQKEWLSSSDWSLNTPLQATIAHQGGQIDTDSIHKLYVKINSAFGFRLQRKHLGTCIQSIALEPYFLHYLENSESGMPFTKGSASYVNLSIQSHAFTLACSYWNASQFISPIGSPLYQVQSIDKPAYFTPNYQRELFFLRCIYEKKLSGPIYFTARFEPVYDVRNAIFDYSYSCYLKYTFQKISGNRQ